MLLAVCLQSREQHSEREQADCCPDHECPAGRSLFCVAAATVSVQPPEDERRHTKRRGPTSCRATTALLLLRALSGSERAALLLVVKSLGPMNLRALRVEPPLSKNPFRRCLQF